jgi:hypothetical protein
MTWESLMRQNATKNPGKQEALRHQQAKNKRLGIALSVFFLLSLTASLFLYQRLQNHEHRFATIADYQDKIVLSLYDFKKEIRLFEQTPETQTHAYTLLQKAFSLEQDIRQFQSLSLQNQIETKDQDHQTIWKTLQTTLALLNTDLKNLITQIPSTQVHLQTIKQLLNETSILKKECMQTFSHGFDDTEMVLHLLESVQTIQDNLQILHYSKSLDTAFFSTYQMNLDQLAVDLKELQYLEKMFDEQYAPYQTIFRKEVSLYNQLDTLFANLKTMGDLQSPVQKIENHLDALFTLLQKHKITENTHTIQIYFSIIIIAVLNILVAIGLWLASIRSNLKQLDTLYYLTYKAHINEPDTHHKSTPIENIDNIENPKKELEDALPEPVIATPKSLKKNIKQAEHA